MGLQFIHSKNVLHGNFGTSNVLRLPSMILKKRKGSKTVEKKIKQWCLIDLTNTRFNLTKEKNYPLIPLGAIDFYFDSCILPPEMFKKLDKVEFYQYEKYWKVVKQEKNIKQDNELTKPWIDMDTGEIFVVKCFSNIGRWKRTVMPSLPYELECASESTDIWSFGIMLFTLCSGGNPLFQSSRFSHPSPIYKLLTNWNTETAEKIIFEYIRNDLAQDLLLHILTKKSARDNLEMSAILSHPFFKNFDELPLGIKRYLKNMEEKREFARISREKEANKKKERVLELSWIENCTVTVTRTRLDTQMKMACSTSELILDVYEIDSPSPIIPYCHLILPYKLARNNLNKLSPITKQDIEIAVKIGKAFLRLSKASLFLVYLEKMLSSRTNNSGKQCLEQWSKNALDNSLDGIEEILSDLKISNRTLDIAEFKELTLKLISIIGKDIHQFLSKPLFIARTLVKDCITEIVSIFTCSQKAYLYLVDEFHGLPVSSSKNNNCYPFLITKHIKQVVLKSLPFMQLCILSVCGASGSVSGFVKLIFEGAYPHIPPSWNDEARGLDHSLKPGMMISMVRNVLFAVDELTTGLESEKKKNRVEELITLQNFLEHVDTNRSFAGLKRVTDKEAALWTTEEGVTVIKKEGDIHSLLAHYQDKSKKN